MLLKSQAPILSPYALLRVVRFPKLPNQAGQLVPKGTGDCLAESMVFMATVVKALALSKETCQRPCLVLALLFGFIEVVYIH